jgi:hypothetical protein
MAFRGMMDEIKIGKDIYNRDFEYLPQGRIKGRNTLSKLGFVRCENQDYMKHGTRYFHYNRLQGRWIGETPVYTTDNRVLMA